VRKMKAITTGISKNTFELSMYQGYWDIGPKFASVVDEYRWTEETTVNKVTLRVKVNVFKNTVLWNVMPYLKVYMKGQLLLFYRWNNGGDYSSRDDVVDITGLFENGYNEYAFELDRIGGPGEFGVNIELERTVEWTGVPPVQAKGEIKDINFPSEVEEGKTVYGSFTIENVGNATGVFKGIADGVSSDETKLDPGERMTVSVSFIMPSYDVNLTLTCMRKEDDRWVEDDRKIVTIRVKVPYTPPPSPAIPWKEIIIGGIAITGVIGGVALATSGEKK